MEEVKIKGKTFRIDQPEEPDFDSIDEVCIQGLLEQIPHPERDKAVFTVNQLRSSYFKVLFDDNDNIAGLIYFSIPGNSDYVHVDFVTAAIKRIGIGSFLIDDIVKFARENRFEGVKLEVSAQDSGAIAFYEAIGFKKEGEIEKSIKLNQMLFNVS